MTNIQQWTIGSTHKFKILTKDETILVERDFTITSVNTISNLQTFAVDVFEKVYSPLGYTQEEYDSVDKEIKIYSLTEMNHEITLVPENHITEINSEPVVYYESKVLAISLGDHPTYQKFTLLRDYLEKAINELVGIDTKVTLLSTSEPFPILERRHRLIDATRKRRSVTTLTPARRLVRREQELEALNKKYAALEQYVLTYLESCASSCGVITPPDPNQPASETEIDRNAFNFDITAKNHLMNPTGIQNTFGL